MEREQQTPSVVIRDWSGMVSNADAEDLPPGTMQKQLNVHSDKQGELRVRRGLREVSFDG